MQDSSVRAVVITGMDKAFAAGADIKEMAPKSFSDVCHLTSPIKILNTFRDLHHHTEYIAYALLAQPMLT